MILVLLSSLSFSRHLSRIYKQKSLTEPCHFPDI